MAHKIAAQLRASGCTVNLRLSYRPGEQMPPIVRRAEQKEKQHLSNSIRRLIRPGLELLSMTGAADIGRHGTDVLMSMQPRNGVFQSFRLRQYLWRLSNAWSQAAPANTITIFDQAFLQAVSALLINRTDLSDQQIDAVLSAIPEADLIVRIDAPATQIEQRLAQRWRDLGRIGRLFETSDGTAADHTVAAERLSELLVRRGSRLSRISSADENQLESAAKQIEFEILRTPPASRPDAAPYFDPCQYVQ